MPLSYSFWSTAFSLLQTINPHGVVVEQHAPLLGRPVRDGGAEAAIDHRERPGQPVDRKVAGEHAALRPEDVDGVTDDRAVRGERPRLAGPAEAGNLDRDIRLRGGDL